MAKMEEAKELVLVTGISGYYAPHLLILLFKSGYRVRGSCRNPSKKYPHLDEICKQYNGELELVKLDLMKDEGWDEAARGCSYFIHMSHPIPTKHAVKYEDFVIPAVEGMKRALNAALKAKIKRFIYTSSEVAMDWNQDQSQTRPYAVVNKATDFTQKRAVGLLGYSFSKVEAEQCIVDFLEQHNQPFDYCTIVPAMTIGPLLGNSLPNGFTPITMAFAGETPYSTRLHWGLVDVRDVSQAIHNALKNEKASNKRYALVGHTCWVTDLLLLAKSRYGPKGYFIETERGPNWFFHFAMWLEGNPLGREYTTLHSDIVHFVDTKPSQEELGIIYTPFYQTLFETIDSLIEKGFIPPPPTMAKYFVIRFVRFLFRFPAVFLLALCMSGFNLQYAVVICVLLCLYRFYQGTM